MQKTQVTDSLLNLINDGAGNYPTMRDGFMREDVRNIFVEALVDGLIKETKTLQIVLEKEWPRFTQRQKAQAFESLIGQHFAKDWVPEFLTAHGTSAELDPLFRLLHPKRPREMGDEMTYLLSWAKIVQEDSVLLAYVLSLCPRVAGRDELSTLASGLGDSLSAADVVPVAAALSAFASVRETNPVAYADLLRLYTCAFVGKKLEHFVPELYRSVREFDVVLVLAEIAREKEDYWPAILRLIANLQGVPYKGTAKSPAFSNGDRIEWRPEWVNSALGVTLANAFLGWMEKKRNRNSREMFSTDFTATLASLPNVSVTIPGVASRLYDLWSRNTMPHSSRCVDAIASLWPELSVEQKVSAVKNVLGKAIEVEGIHSYPDRAKLDELTHVISSLAKCNDPSVYTHVIPVFDAVLSLPDVELFAYKSKDLVPMLANPLSAVAVSRWVREALKAAAGGPGGMSQGANTAQQWVTHLASTKCAQIVQFIVNEGTLPELVADMTISFLHDPLFSYHPYREPLRSFMDFQHAIGRVDFEEAIDAALERDVGKHAFASLLITLAPEHGAAAWSTIESMYHEEIVGCTLRSKPEVIELLRETISSAIRMNPPEPVLTLPAL
jgi:hypothetical protein